MVNLRPDLEVPGPSWTGGEGIESLLLPRPSEPGKKYSEDQDRDEVGRWTDEGGGGGGFNINPIIEHSARMMAGMSDKDTVKFFNRCSHSTDEQLNERAAKLFQMMEDLGKTIIGFGAKDMTDEEFDDLAARIREMTDEELRDLAEAIVELRKENKKFSEDQPRDESGKWTSDGGGFRELSGDGLDAVIAYGNENLKPETPLTDQEKAVVGSYVGSGFETINSGLRGETELSEYDRRDIVIIDGAIEKSPLPEGLMLYRGVGMTEYRDAPQFLSEMRVGSAIKDPAFLSTTLDLDIGQSFAGTRTESSDSRGWLMRIEAPAGTPGLFITDEMAASQGETEVLLGRNTPLTVTSLDETNRVVTVRVGGAAEPALVLENIGLNSAKYSDDQERDDHGRWTSDGSALEGDLPQGELSAAHFAGLNEQSQLATLTWMAKNDVSMIGLMDQVRGRIDAAAIEEAKVWYPSVRAECDAIEERTGEAITAEQAGAVFAAISPRCEWEDPKTGEGEMKYVPSMAEFVASGLADGKSPEEANLAWRAWYSDNNENIAASTGEGMRPAFFNGTGEKAFAVLMGESTSDEILTDNKTRSFYDNIVAPGQTNEVTIDVHMMKAYEQVNGWTYDETVKLLGQGTDNNRLDTHVSSYGYTVLAQAVRNVANEMGVSPDVVQAAYWINVQGEPHL